MVWPELGCILGCDFMSVLRQTLPQKNKFGPLDFRVWMSFLRYVELDRETHHLVAATVVA